MPLYIPRGGPRIFFVHVPKTAGTAITNYLGRRFGTPVMSNRTTFMAEFAKRGFVTPPGHFTAEDLTEFIPEDIDLCFTMVRDPIDRIVSEFRFQKQAQGRMATDFSSWLRRMFAGAAKDPRIYHNHIRPQADFVPANAEVFRFETGFDALVARLDAVAGDTVAYGIERANSSAKELGDVTVHREDAEAILRFYAEDYDRFGFSRPDLSAMPSDARASWRNLSAQAMAPLLVAKEKRRWLK
ncbi:sulfotransferase family 2 domain-containing protein [Parvularcula lutaonensis]|uniref:Sulfotransferase family 2 domain-containing protein n=1 Tax=Parvularcula lutaonensis TaxID=491923 RepID=A0ABV7MEU2_9PROT|nr:sulfotransferase family 2 domain-containing protein [Parvularcula lutaonensis]GGY40590.1 hypothetical protein GCM10007148_06350 [Parvularcula lutaonensis]